VNRWSNGAPIREEKTLQEKKFQEARRSLRQGQKTWKRLEKKAEKKELKFKIPGILGSLLLYENAGILHGLTFGV